MSTHFMLELLGYLASALIAVSLMMSSVLRLRMINMIGAATFSLYGLLIRAYPVAVLNGFMVLVNAYHITRMVGTKQYFQLLSLRPDSGYLRYFLNFYRTEIRRILPEFEYQPLESQIAFFILHDCNPVGVFIGEEKPRETLLIELGFVVPRYRAPKIGRFLLVQCEPFFRERGIKEIVIAPRTAEYGAHLVKVGFGRDGGRDGDQPGSFRIPLAGK
jgi:GNAT superfamily N-acetyltransferase